jgi:low temperature requirement protein LtrA
MDVDEGGVRLAMLAATGSMLIVALAVPGAFGDDAVLFGVAYLLVRLVHVGAGFELTWRVIAAAALGIVVVSALWWLYFDVAASFARGRLMQASGLEQARLARDAYNYLHLPMVAGIVLFALGLKTTLGQIGDALDIVPAVGLCGGAALYEVIRYRAARVRVRHLSSRRDREAPTSGDRTGALDHLVSRRTLGGVTTT